MPLPLIAAAGSMLAQGAAGQAAAESTIEGARRQAMVDAMNRAFQKELFEKDIARQQPFLDFGYGGVEQLRQGITAEGTPEYQFRQQQGMNALANMAGISPDVARAAQTRMQRQLGPDEYANAYSRAIDRLKIAQGQAGTAGQRAMDYGGALAGAYGQAGQANALANMMYQQQMQQAGTGFAEQASSIPSYIYGTNRLAQMNRAQQPTWYQGGVAPSGSAGYGPGL